MKILQISAVYGKGSVGNIVKNLHTFLLNKHVESRVLYGVANDKLYDKTLCKSTSKIERYLSHLFYLITGINFNCCFFGTNKIKKYIKNFKPDIIHIHCYNDFYINIHSFLKWINRHNIKLAITQHCEHYYTGSCGYSLECNKWKNNGCDNNCHFFKVHKKGYPVFDQSKYMWKKMYKTFSNYNLENLYIVSCTPWLDERMLQSKILGKVKNHYIILNGGDSKIYKQYECLKQGNKKIVLYVTPRFSDEIKGSIYINDIASKFKNRDDIIFHIVGNVPDNYKLEKNILNIGPKYGEELAKEYSNACVTIMLSKAECFPMVCVESLLCGTKVVAFECGGPDKVYSKEMVSFVKWGDFNKMYNEIFKIVNNPYNKYLISQKAATLYSKETMCNNYYQFYKNIKDNI